jgi:hypothetical protein
MGTFDELLQTSSSFFRLLDNIEEVDNQPVEPVKRFSLDNISFSDCKKEGKLLPLPTNLEEKREGAVKWRVHLEYLRAGGGVIVGVLTLVLTFCVRETIFVYNSWWLAQWTNDENYRYRVNINCTNTSDQPGAIIQAMNATEWRDYQNHRFYVYAGLFVY